MKAYRVKGTLPMGVQDTTFTLEVASAGEKEARDHAYSILGSKHRVPRSRIAIQTVEEIAKDQITDDVVLGRVEKSGK
ncbi:MAG TPA: 50S ribosomal protein L18Ae [Candidatus Thermoplasmatota archaeon]|nr:50S ribosomal protein L18Ae [Candidatus Thermoplasmatota archaeon]